MSKANPLWQKRKGIGARLDFSQTVELVRKRMVAARPFPPEIFMLLDERNDGLFGVDMSNTGTLDGFGPSNPYWMIDYPAAYHNGAGEVSFADGHIEKHRWLEATTLVSLGKAIPRSHTSSTDRDVEWLQDHCTELR